MPQITVSVAGSERSVAAGTTAGDLFDERTGPHAVVVARVGGELRDLSHVLADGDVVEPVTIDSEDGLAVLRHSPAHVLAQAVQQINPKARLGIGPPIRDGFYYDFDVETPFTPDDVKALERTMQRIVNEGQTFARRVVTDDDARAELAGLAARAEHRDGVRRSFGENGRLTAIAGRVRVGDVLVGDVDQGLIGAQGAGGQVEPEKRRGHARLSTNTLWRAACAPCEP